MSAVILASLVLYRDQQTRIRKKRTTEHFFLKATIRYLPRVFFVEKASAKISSFVAQPTTCFINTKTKHILGIDAAWTATRSSGLCLLKWEQDNQPEVIRLGRSYEEFLEGEIRWNEKATASAPRLDEIIQQIGNTPQVVALDIPLSPEPITGYREADRQITRRYSRMGAAVHSPTKDRPGKIAEILYQQLIEAGISWAGTDARPDRPYFMEVYPHVTIIEMLGLDYRLPYKVQKKGQYWKEDTPEVRYQKSIQQLNFLKKGIETELHKPLDEFLPELQEEEKYTLHFLKSYEDLLDAIVCALSGYYFLTGKAEGLGDETSAIWIPKLKP